MVGCGCFSLHSGKDFGGRSFLVQVCTSWQVTSLPIHRFSGSRLLLSQRCWLQKDPEHLSYNWRAVQVGTPGPSQVWKSFVIFNLGWEALDPAQTLFVYYFWIYVQLGCDPGGVVLSGAGAGGRARRPPLQTAPPPPAGPDHGAGGMNSGRNSEPPLNFKFL